MDISIYYLLAGLAVLYIAVRIYNRKGSKRRKSRKFMEGYERRDKSGDKDKN
ncbi:MAG: hypothetical protein WBM43_12085 [Flavobacteriaceae bacterium]